MDVFVVPASGDRYALYCETADGVAPGETPEAPRGVGARLAARFHAMIAHAEHERRRPAEDDAGVGWARRFVRWMLRHVAETVAEQRLLWHLRHQTAATLVHPDDLAAEVALDLMHAMLARDFGRHRFWLVVDVLLAAITGPLFFFVPGPNLVAYYFVFRAVGHVFAWRGARQGLKTVRWTAEAHGALTDLRTAAALPPGERAARVQEVATRLRLEHLPAFFERVAVSPS